MSCICSYKENLKPIKNNWGFKEHSSESKQEIWTMKQNYQITENDDSTQVPNYKEQDQQLHSFLGYPFATLTS